MSEKRTLKRLIVLTGKLERVKELYREVDELTEALVQNGFSAASLEGYLLTKVDHFEEKNVVWRGTPFRRFEIQVTPDPTRPI